MLDPLASGEFHAQEGTRALPGQPQRTGGEETPTERAGLRVGKGLKGACE